MSGDKICGGAETVHGAFAATTARWPDRAALNVLGETATAYGIAPGEITYADLLAQADDLAGRLAQAGYERGQRVMLLLENRPAYFIWWLALNRLGLSVVPVNPDLRHGELAYMIGHAEPVLCVATPEWCAEMRAAATEAGVEMAVIALGDDAPAPRADAALALRDGGADNAEAALLYTSGTTGQPKGCILTNAYFTTAGQWYVDAGGLCALTEEGERMLTPLPLFHMNAMACSFMGMVAVGGCLTVLDRFHPRTWWHSVAEARATCLHYLGVMPSILMQADPAPQDRAHCVRFGFGAGVDPKLHAPFEARFGFPLVEGWAMTETGVAAAITNNIEPRRVGVSCLGRAGASMEVRVVDEAGQDAGTAPGELLVRRAGPQRDLGFFAGYFKNQKATDEVWQGGWFHTGDLVRREADGSIFFVDRKKNVIRRSGENIAAVEVESVLMRHPDISGIAVAPFPDEIRGDEVFACIVAASGGADATGIAQWALDQMAYYKVPGYIAFVPELPLTATQKIQRAAMKSLALGLLEHPDTVDLRALKKRQTQ